jgi:hypothetical protein
MFGLERKAVGIAYVGSATGSIVAIGFVDPGSLAIYIQIREWSLPCNRTDADGPW